MLLCNFNEKALRCNLKFFPHITVKIQPMHTLAFVRSLVFIMLQAIATILFGVIAMLILPLPYKFRYRVITLWSKFVILLAKYICGIEYQVTGLENLLQTPAILLCNHQSAWETLFLQTILPYQCWVVKKELLNVPFFGWGLWALEPIAIDRKKSSSLRQLVEQGKAKLSAGRWVVLFPEGSRVAPGKLGKFSKSGALLAKESQMPIIPMAHNAGNCWPRNAFIKKAGIIRVNIGPAIYPNTLTTDEIHQRTENWIKEKLPL